MSFNKQKLLERLRSGDEKAKQEAEHIIPQLLLSQLDLEDLKIIGNAVADCPKNRDLVHRTDEFWVQLENNLEKNTAQIWISVLFNLYNGTDETRHLELVANKLASCLVEFFDSIPHDLVLDLFLRAVRYVDLKRISVDWEPKLLDNLLKLSQVENEEVNILEIMAHLFGINPEYEHYIGQSRELVWKTWKMVKSTEEHDNWGISVLGAVSSSPKFIPTNDLLVELFEAVQSGQPSSTAISAVILGNLTTDVSKAKKFVYDHNLDVSRFIDTCYHMNAVQLQSLHLLKNLSNDSSILQDCLLPNGIVKLITHVLELKVFPLITRIAAIIARNIQKEAYDIELLNVLIKEASVQDDLSVRNELFRATAIPNHCLTDPNYLLLLLNQRPPSMACTLAIAQFSSTLLLQHREELLAFLEECQSIDDPGLRNNAAYLAASINENDNELNETIKSLVNK